VGNGCCACRGKSWSSSWEERCRLKFGIGRSSSSVVDVMMYTASAMILDCCGYGDTFCCQYVCVDSDSGVRLIGVGLSKEFSRS